MPGLEWFWKIRTTLPESPSPRELLNSQIEHLTAASRAPPLLLDRSHNLIKELGTAAEKIGPDLRVAKAKFHQPPTRWKLSQHSGVVL